MFKAAGAATRGIFPRPFRGTLGLFQSFWNAAGTDDRKSRPRWSRDEELYLARDYAKGTDVGFIAGLIGRPISAVRRKAIRLGVHRPRSGRAAKAANAMNAPPPPHISDLDSILYRGFSYLRSPAARSKTGRIIWTNDAIATLAGLWKRLYSPTCIAQFFGLKTTAVAEAARRAGLPDRRGLPIISTCSHRDPFAAPENQTLVGMMVQKLCRLTGKLFFVRPREKKTVHFSFQGRIALRRRAADVDNWSIDLAARSSEILQSQTQFSFA